MVPVRLDSLGSDIEGLCQFDTGGLRAHWRHGYSGGV
jgi:hypothetical protein